MNANEKTLNHTLALFHGTRFDWVYATRDFIEQCAQRGHPVCHCTAPMRQDHGPGEGRAEATYKIGRAEDIHGRPLTASWQNWSPPWGCYSNPDFFRLMEQDVTFAIESGATYMQIDDPDTRQMLKWGGDPKDKETRGCFCGHCLENQKILCLSYCLGMNFVAPWDVWRGGSERLYGEPQDYNHFFAFEQEKP